MGSFNHYKGGELGHSRGHVDPKATYVYLRLPIDGQDCQDTLGNIQDLA